MHAPRIQFPDTFNRESENRESLETDRKMGEF